MKGFASPWSWWVALVILGAAAGGVWFARGKAAAKSDPDAVWREGEIAFESMRYKDAEKAVARLAALRTPTPHDRLLRAQLAMLHKREDEALEELAAVPDGGPLTGRARLMSGQLELRRNRLAYAENHLRAAARADPTLVAAHRELIFIYGIQLRRVELSAEFAALSNVTSLTYENAFQWCLTRNIDWDGREHHAMLRTYLDADPGDRFSRLALAENLRQLGRREEADGVLAPLPMSDPEARVVRVRIALDRNDDELTDKLLAEAPQGVPELDRLIGRRALARRDGKTGLTHYRAAYEAQPDHRDGVFGLGQALAMTGDAEGAAPWVAMAKDFDALGTLLQRAATPEGRRDPGLVKALGAACEKVHRLPEARAWYTLAIQADALDRDAQKALFRIKAAEAAAAAGG